MVGFSLLPPPELDVRECKQGFLLCLSAKIGCRLRYKVELVQCFTSSGVPNEVMGVGYNVSVAACRNVHNSKAVYMYMKRRGSWVD